MRQAAQDMVKSQSLEVTFRCGHWGHDLVLKVVMLLALGLLVG